MKYKKYSILFFCFFSVLLIYLLINKYINNEYERILNEGYDSMINLSSTTTIEDLEKKGYINLNDDSNDKLNNIVNQYNIAVMNEKPFGFHYFLYPKLYFLLYNPSMKEVNLWEYDILEQYIQDPGLIYLKLEVKNNKNNVVYTLIPKKNSDTIGNYGKEIREIYSYEK